MMASTVKEILQGQDAEKARPLRSSDRLLLDQVVALCAYRRRALNLAPDRPSRTTILAESFCFVETFDHRRQRLAEVGRRQQGGSLHRMALTSGQAPAYTSLEDVGGPLLSRREDEVERVPVARLDDLGWDDIDLIVIGCAADLVSLMEGAQHTLRAQRPTLLVLAQALSPQAMTGMMREFEQLFADGYSIAAANNEGFILHADARNNGRSTRAPAMVKISGLSKNEQIMLLDAPEEMVRDINSDHALIGRTLVPARIIQLKTTGGVRRLVRIPLARSVKTDGFAGLRLSNRKLVPFPARQEILSIDDLIDRTSLRVDASGLYLGLPPELAALITDYRVTLDYGDDNAFVVAHGRTDDGQLMDNIRLRWPLNAIRPLVATVSVDLFIGDRAIGTQTTEIDFARHHISNETVNGYLNHGGGGNPAISALARALGCRTYFAEDGYKPGVSLVWGVLRGSKTVIDEAARRKSIFYYVDHAYFNRGHGKTYRITRDRFEAGPVRDCPDDRLKALGVEVAPWQPEGRFIVVCPPTAHFLAAHGCHDWLKTTMETLRQHTDREIIIREKPLDGQLSPLAQALLGAHALVTHSSNVAVEAAVLGTPVFVSETSAAWPVGLSDLSRIETPVRPDRDKWLAHLAYSQFTFDELESGECWRLLQEFERRPLIADGH